MKTIQVKDKPYVKVHERVEHLRENYEHRNSINTDYVHFPERKLWVVKAVLTLIAPDGNKQTYSGLAQEVESDDYNKTNYASALENAETSAIGREKSQGMNYLRKFLPCLNPYRSLRK